MASNTERDLQILVSEITPSVPEPPPQPSWFPMISSDGETHHYSLEAFESLSRVYAFCGQKGGMLGGGGRIGPNKSSLLLLLGSRGGKREDGGFQEGLQFFRMVS